MDGDVNWQFNTDPDAAPEQLVTDEQFAAYEAELAADLDDAAGEFGEVEPIDWQALTADEATAHWRALDRFVTWLRNRYALPPTVVPPLWHRHPELVEELSALHTHRLECYAPGGSGSGPITWHADFADARERLREWVATSGTRLDRDRPSRATSWPGEPPAEPGEEQPITDRKADFAAFVADDLAARRATKARAARNVRAAGTYRQKGGS
ncbi:hypothetical protein FB00_13605 [Cellulosimicrobium funkei]|uniref:DUF4913 domain-containing protein n=1 Tax=Cellulosimicrobium funkei TaxID=264251 RepID=A0A0H2KL59_9MICO|nr:hypothetical protein [Cellulosimicrobium funkei]KLN34201.1 hypothetical protein FB00_13605 [Cellulosimicrobium funkei]